MMSNATGSNNASQYYRALANEGSPQRFHCQTVRIVAMAFCLVGCVFALCAANCGCGISLERFELLGLMVMGGIPVSIRLAATGKEINADMISVAIILVVTLFHFGLLPLYVYSPDRITPYYIVDDLTFYESCCLSAACLFAFSGGTLLLSARSASASTEQNDGALRRAVKCLKYCNVFVLIGIALLIAKLGSGFLKADYDAKLRDFGDGGGIAFQLFNMLARLSMSLPAVELYLRICHGEGWRALRHCLALAIVSAGIYGIIGFRTFSFTILLGVALVLVATQQIRLRTRMAIFGIVTGGYVLLWMAGVIAMTRDDRSGYEKGIPPVLETIAEMGRTQGTVARTISLMEQEPFGHGCSYWQATAAALLPIVASKQEYREGLATWLARESNPQYYYRDNLTLGYSCIAELYYNFGSVGAVIGAFLFGVVLRIGELAVHNRTPSVFAAVSIVCCVAALVSVRNDFESFALRGLRTSVGVWMVLAVCGMSCFAVSARKRKTQKAIDL